MNILYQEKIHLCLDKIINNDKPLAFVDAYQQDEFLGASGCFVDCIPNAKAYHHTDFYKILNQYEGNIVVCCQLVNNENKFEAYTQEGNTSAFFGEGHSKPCIILFVNVPYQDKTQLFINDMATIFCNYQKHLEEWKQ